LAATFFCIENCDTLVGQIGELLYNAIYSEGAPIGVFVYITAMGILHKKRKQRLKYLTIFRNRCIIIVCNYVFLYVFYVILHINYDF